MNNTSSQLSVEALRTELADAQRFPQSWIETWLGFASTNWQLLLVKPRCLRCFLLTPADIQVASICVGRDFSFWIHVGPYTWIYYCCCTQHLLWMRFCAALTSVTQLSVAVSAPYRGLLHFQSSCVGIMRHTEQLSISTQLVSYHWFLFLWLRPFFPCTVERSSQGRACGGPAKGLEGNWVFSYHSRHSTHIPLLQGPVTSVHASQEALTRSQPHIVPLLSSASTEFIHT